MDRTVTGPSTKRGRDAVRVVAPTGIVAALVAVRVLAKRTVSDDAGLARGRTPDDRH